MSSLVGKDLEKFRDKQHNLIFQQNNQPAAMKALADMVKSKKNDYDIVGQMKNYFRAQEQRKNLDKYDKLIAGIYADNLEKIYNQMTFKITDANKIPTRQQYEEEQGEEVTAEVPVQPQQPPLKQATQPKKGKTGKKGKATKARELEEAFTDLMSDDPNAYRVFLEKLDLAPEKSRKVTKADLLNLKNRLGFVGNKSTKTDVLLQRIKDSIGQYATENNLNQVLSDWKATQTEPIKEAIKKKETAGEKLTKEEEEIQKASLESSLASGKENIDDIILEKFKKDKNLKIAEDFLQFNPSTNTVNFKKLDFKPKKKGYSEIQNNIIKLLTEVSYLEKYNDQIKKVMANPQKSFTDKTPLAKAQEINRKISHSISTQDLNDMVEKGYYSGWFTSFVNYVMDTSKTDVDIHDVNEAIRALKNLGATDLNVLETELGTLNQEVIKQTSEWLKPAEDFLNRPADISKLPERVKPSKVKAEDILSPLDRYNKEKEALQKKIKDEDYDKLKTKKNMGTATAPEIAKLEEIENDKIALKKLEPEAKKELAKKQGAVSKRTTATKRSGKARPHFLNPTEKAIKNAIGETAEEQIRDIKNWYIFDLPEYHTGVGNKYENPLVKQNADRDMMLVNNTDIFSGMTTYLLSEGVDERKDFFMSSRPALTKESIGRGLFEVEVEETEKQFLQRFNEGSNGLFSQDITKKEVSDFKNIYQTPPDNIFNDNKNTGEKHKFEFTNNRGIKHTDKIWINNINLFYDNAPILG
jgi:hypothetical protein